MAESSNGTNIVSLKKRRRARTNEEALQFLREAAGESGVLEVATIADLRHLFLWEKVRTWQAVRRWTKKGKNQRVEKTRNPDTGHIRLRVVPDRGDTDTRQKTGQDTRHDTRQTQVNRLDKNSNTNTTSETYKATTPAEASQNGRARAQIFAPSEGIPGLDMSSPKSRFRWWWRRRRNVPPPPAPRIITDRPPLTLNDAVTWLVAVALTAVAASFSVSGMVVLFPGAPAGATIMGIVMEAAKLVIAGWLGGHAHAISWLNRIVLFVILLGLMSINALGLYSQLVAAHVGHLGQIVASNEANDGRLAAQIEVQEGRLANIKERLAQLDQIVAGAAAKGKANTATNIRQEQQRDRAKLAEERDAVGKELARLKTARVESKARGHAAETEAAPIQYVAQLLGVRAGGEEVIRWFIALMDMCCDPCAVTLIFTCERLRRRRRAR